MPEWIVSESGIESSGACIQSLVDAFGPFKSNISRWLVSEGIGRLGRDKIVEFDVNSWYPVQAELNALRKTCQEVGLQTLYHVGVKTIEFSVIPPLSDVVEAMYSLNIAYHLNHRRNGMVMFDKHTGVTLSGIGDFEVQNVDLKNREILIRAPGPFPCVYNRGIVHGLALKMQKTAQVDLVDPALSINRGNDYSLYRVTW